MPSLCDTNIWVALAIAGHVHGSSVRDWFAGIDQLASLYFCRATQQGFLRLMTRAAIVAPYGYEPLTNAQAWDAYEGFLADDRVTFCSEEPPRLESQWYAFSSRSTASPNLWMDAYLAAFAFTNGWQLVTTDHAFTQFPGLDLLLLG